MPGDSQQPIGMTPTARHTVAGSINAVTAGASAENDLRQDLIDQRFGERYVTPTFSCMSTFASQVPTSEASEKSDAPNHHDGRLGREDTLWRGAIGRSRPTMQQWLPADALTADLSTLT